MSNKEAINKINDVLGSTLLYDDSIDYQLNTDDVEWLEKAKEALEKQIPKKPIETVKIEPVIAENGAYVDADTYVLLQCPLCGEQVGIDDLFCDKFCRECGQAIDWSGEVEE